MIKDWLWRALETFEKTSFDVIGNVVGIRNFHPSNLPPPLACSATPSSPPPIYSWIGGVGSHDRFARVARRIDFKQNGFKGVYPCSLTIRVSYKSICVLANEGWKWRILIGRYLDHSHSVNKGFERKPVLQRHNCFTYFAKCNVDQRC